VVKEVLAPQRKPSKKSERLPKTLDELEVIANFLEKFEVDTDLSAEDVKRGRDVLNRFRKRCRVLAGQLKRQAMDVEADSGNSETANEDADAA